jgi:hypothetical protein
MTARYLRRRLRRPTPPGRHQTATAVRTLLLAGLTIRDVAEMFSAHPRAIVALLNDTPAAATPAAPMSNRQGAA